MPDAQPTLHRAARAEDAFHRWRARRARRRGMRTTIVPYTGYGAAPTEQHSGWIRVLCRVVLAREGDGGATQRAAKVRGWRSFFSIPVTDEPILVTAGNAQQTLLPARGGVIDVVLTAALEPGWQQIELSTEGSEPVTAPVFVVRPGTGFGVVSDVDDTVMVTALPRPLLAAWNTFVLDEHARRPVSGMAVLYERLHRRHPDAPFIYLSTGAWNVAPTLTRFLSRNLYPPGALLLTDWGPTPDAWFRSGRGHKRSNLARLAQEFPDIRWLLIGDDGQHDEALYAEFAAAHPGRVAAVAIRQLTPGEAVLAGGRSPGGPPETGRDEPELAWIHAPDGAGIAQKLADLGMLPPGESP